MLNPNPMMTFGSHGMEISMLEQKGSVLNHVPR